MRAWRQAWWRLWHDERVDIRSPVQVPVAAERLAALVPPHVERLKWTANADQRVVAGRVSAGRVRLMARFVGGTRGTTASLLRGALVPDFPGGCRLEARLGVGPERRAWTLVMSVLLVVFLVVGVLGTVHTAAGGHGISGVVVFAVVPLPAWALLVPLVARQDAAGRAHDVFLMERIREALEA
jgi:hypothetical protein